MESFVIKSGLFNYDPETKKVTPYKNNGFLKITLTEN